MFHNLRFIEIALENFLLYLETHQCEEDHREDFLASAALGKEMLDSLRNQLTDPKHVIARLENAETLTRAQFWDELERLYRGAHNGDLSAEANILGTILGCMSSGMFVQLYQYVEAFTRMMEEIDAANTVKKEEVEQSVKNASKSKLN